MPKKLIIAGCGLSGMLSALNLAKLNFEITVLERRQILSDQWLKDSRTTAVTAESATFIKNLNLWDEFIQIAAPIEQIYVVDDKGKEMIHFENKQPMGYMIKNEDFKLMLFRAITRQDNIVLIDKCEYIVEDNISNGCKILVNNKIMEAAALLLCDGSNSFIRQYYFTDDIYKDYKQKAIVFNVKHQNQHANTAVEHFMPLGPFAILPLKSSYESAIVWTVTEDISSHFLALSNEDKTYLLKQNFGSFLGEIEIQTQPEAFALKARLANSYFFESIILLADTAHTIHPLAGQGLNQGIKDIQALSHSLLAQGINKAAFAYYEKQRKLDNMSMFRLTDSLNKIFSNSSSILWWLRQQSFKLIKSNSLIKSYLNHYAMGKR